MPEPAISKYDRDTQRFDCVGLDLNRPVDSVRPGHYSILKNVRSYQQGRIEPRPGLTSLGIIAPGNDTCHSLRRLNDPRTSDYTYISGVGGVACFGKTTPFTKLQYASGDLAFSGDPLALVTNEPEESPESWMFIADRAPTVTPLPAALATTLKKVNVTGTVHQFGMPAPIVPPTATLTAPSYKYTDPDFDFQYVDNAALQTDWIADGVVAAAATLVTRINTTISVILYDVGTTGWACVQPADTTNMGVGMILLVNAGAGTAERVIIQEIHPVSVNTTISSVIYDDPVANVGLCSIVLTDPIENIEENAFFHNITKTEFNRVLSVTNGISGALSIRCSTNATYAAGDTISVVASFRAYFANHQVATNTITAKGAESVVAVGIGTVTRTAAYDFSSIAANVAATQDDYIHISLLADNPALVTEIKLLFDCDKTTNDFTKNYFYVAIGPDTLTSSAQSLTTLQTALNTAIQNTLTFDAGNTSLSANTSPDIINQQISLGESQWSEMRMRLSSFIRVGTDTSRGWANIAAVRVQITTTGSVTFGFDDIQLGGGFGPDTTTTSVPYVYRYRARCSSTGAKSNPSPPVRGISLNGQPVSGGIVAYRQSITISIPQFVQATEADVLDIERYGGDVLAWHYAGTCSNTSSPSFIDTYADSVISTNPETDVTGSTLGFGLDSFQPWPIRDVPSIGTCDVAGTTVRARTGSFNLSWSLGTTLIINSSTSVTIYRVISATELEIFENVGTISNVPFTVPAPLVTSQPLPCLWGPLDSVLFACGDPINPGRLYYTGVNSEGCAESDFYDVTSASEPLMNGCIYNGRAYVFSSERFFQIIPQSGPIRYTVQEIPGGKGLFSRWALTRLPDKFIGSLASDGLYKSTGGPQVSITDDDLYPLFPTESILGNSVGPIGAPDIDASQATSLRLDWAISYLYFDYIDVDGNRRTLIYNPGDDVTPAGWFYDVYSVPANFHYGDEGPGVRAIFIGGSGSNAKLYQYTKNTGDDGANFNCQVRTPSRDQGDSRSYKLYGDIMLDCDPSGTSLSVIAGINNFTAVGAATTVITGEIRDQFALNVNADAWQSARNIALDITFDVNSADRPLLYIWEPRSTFTSAPIAGYAWEISPSTLGFYNYKSLGFGRVSYVSNTDLDLSVTLDAVPQSTISLPSSQGKYNEYVFRFPVYKAKQYKFRIASSEVNTVDVTSYMGFVFTPRTPLIDTATHVADAYLSYDFTDDQWLEQFWPDPTGNPLPGEDVTTNQLILGSGQIRGTNTYIPSLKVGYESQFPTIGHTVYYDNVIFAPRYLPFGTSTYVSSGGATFVGSTTVPGQVLEQVTWTVTQLADGTVPIITVREQFWEAFQDTDPAAYAAALAGADLRTLVPISFDRTQEYYYQLGLGAFQDNLTVLSTSAGYSAPKNAVVRPSTFRLSTGNTYIEVKEWGSNDAYRQLKVFSDYSYIQG